MVVLSVQMTTNDGRRDEILRSLRSLVGPSQAEMACVSCRVLHEADDPDAITFVEAWATRSDLERHVRSHQHRQLLSVVDLSHTPPEIRLDGVATIGGGVELMAEFAAYPSEHTTPGKD